MVHDQRQATLTRLWITLLQDYDWLEEGGLLKMFEVKEIQGIASQISLVYEHRKTNTPWRFDEQLDRLREAESAKDWHQKRGELLQLYEDNEIQADKRIQENVWQDRTNNPLSG